ncbi:MAG: hypothetical protein JWP66_407 [Naasia sp.]|nr:hypothetical protein [Naasia sp.]
MSDETSRDDRDFADSDAEQAKLRAEHRRELGLDPAFDGVDISEPTSPDLQAGDDLDTGSGSHRPRD